MNSVTGIISTVAGVALAAASWLIAEDYAPAVTAFLMMME